MDCGTKKRQPSGLHQKPNRNPAQHPQGVGRIRKAAEPPTAAHRLRFREEGQGNGADGIFAKKCRSKADFAPTWTVVPKKMQARSRYVATTSKNFTAFGDTTANLGYCLISIERFANNATKFSTQVLLRILLGIWA